MLKIKLISIFFITTVVLNGCSSLNSNFECSMKPGVRCESLDQVNDQVNRGEIGGTTMQNISLYKPVAAMHPQSVYKDEINVLNHQPLRYGETVMRVWVAPYEDTAGNYHQESDIYTVIKPSHWIGNPPKDISISED